MWSRACSTRHSFGSFKVRAVSLVPTVVMIVLLLTAGPATSQQQQEAKPSPSGVSCTVVPGAKIVEFSPAATLTQALKGRVAGLQIKTADGWAGSGSTVSLRGVSSAVGPFEPMVFVDGARLTPLNRTNTGDHSAIQILDLINPEDVARVEVLRGPAATAMYGTQASGGVIHVFTKQGNPKLAPVTDPKRGCP